MNGRKKILVVDDTSMFRELETLFLGRLGDVLTASSGEEALACARREFPDVVVTDLNMPGMDGDTLCRAIKADRDLHGTPVIVVTPGENREDHARAVRAQADDVLAKPLSRIQLNLATARLLRDSGYRSLMRVSLGEDVKVRLTRAEAGAWGVARDLSRGGIFVESPGQLPPATEVNLDFQLPDGRSPLKPSARVMWNGQHPRTGMRGMGLRFLALDRKSTDRIDAFIHEHSGPATGSVEAAP
jgi:uncharacterized protein (TIGR02266 family)